MVEKAKFLPPLDLLHVGLLEGFNSTYSLVWIDLSIEQYALWVDATIALVTGISESLVPLGDEMMKNPRPAQYGDSRFNMGATCLLNNSDIIFVVLLASRMV